MATLEQIIEEASRLPVEEQRRLRAALETLDSNAEAQPANQKQPQSLHVNNGDDEIRQLRMDWLKTHREEYGGQYVALDGDQLLAVGPNYRIAKEKALAVGNPNAFVTYLSKPHEIAEMGGWA
jgi:regulator of replication initiation timing